MQTLPECFLIPPSLSGSSVQGSLAKRGPYNTILYCTILYYTIVARHERYSGRDRALPARRTRKLGRKVSSIKYDSTVQCSVVQYSVLQYTIVQYSVVKYSVLQYSVSQHSTVQYSIAQHSIVQYSMTIQKSRIVDALSSYALTCVLLNIQRN